MDKNLLYYNIAKRKSKPRDFEPYTGGNGRVDRCVDLFKKGILKSGGTLVDCGCGIGDLCYALKDRFETRLGLDISWQNLKAAIAKNGITQYKVCDFDNMGFSSTGPRLSGLSDVPVEYNGDISDNSVDCVTALDLIEHLIDPGYFARECYRVLKPGGQVFVNTPNIQFWKHIEELVFNGRLAHTSGDKEVFHGGHLAFYTYNDLVSIFDSAGFKDFRQIKDEENFVEPPDFWLKTQKCKNQQDYVTACMRLGNSNLLFLCNK